MIRQNENQNKTLRQQITQKLEVSTLKSPEPDLVNRDGGSIWTLAQRAMLCPAFLVFQMSTPTETDGEKSTYA